MSYISFLFVLLLTRTICAIRPLEKMLKHRISHIQKHKCLTPFLTRDNNHSCHHSMRSKTIKANRIAREARNAKLIAQEVFSKLPKELRQLIWNYLSPGEYRDQGHVIIPLIKELYGYTFCTAEYPDPGNNNVCAEICINDGGRTIHPFTKKTDFGNFRCSRCTISHHSVNKHACYPYIIQACTYNACVGGQQTPGILPNDDMYRQVASLYPPISGDQKRWTRVTVAQLTPNEIISWNEHAIRSDRIHQDNLTLRTSNAAPPGYSFACEDKICLNSIVVTPCNTILLWCRSKSDAKVYTLFRFDIQTLQWLEEISAASTRAGKLPKLLACDDGQSILIFKSYQEIQVKINKLTLTSTPLTFGMPASS